MPTADPVTGLIQMRLAGLLHTSTSTQTSHRTGSAESIAKLTGGERKQTRLHHFVIRKTTGLPISLFQSSVTTRAATAGRRRPSVEQSRRALGAESLVQPSLCPKPTSSGRQWRGCGEFSLPCPFIQPSPLDCRLGIQHGALVRTPGI